MTSRYKISFLDSSETTPWSLFRNREQYTRSDRTGSPINSMHVREDDERLVHKDDDDRTATYHQNDNVNAYVEFSQNRNNTYGMVYHQDTRNDANIPSIASRIKYFEQGTNSHANYKTHSEQTFQPNLTEFSNDNVCFQKGTSEEKETRYTDTSIDKSSYGANSLASGESLYNLPSTFQEDPGSQVDSIRCPFVDCACHRSQASPYISGDDDLAHSGVSSDDDRYSQRRIANVNPCAYYDSGRSSSTDTGSETFNIIVCDSTTDLTNGAEAYNDLITDVDQTITKPADNKGNGLCYNMARNSPEIDSSTLDEFKTAPSTPDSVAEDFFFVDVECLSEIPTDMYINDMCDNAEGQQSNSRQPPDCSHENMNQCNEATRSSSASALTTFTEGLSNTLDEGFNHVTDGVYHGINGAMAGDNATRDNNPKGVSKETAADGNTVHLQRVNNEATNKLVFPQPIILDQCQIQYEVDNESGKVRTVGKGSFGQVYKARFSDPNMYFLPLVVKEFDEKYSRRKDIIEEAQRLTYLWDTGYVPNCYGIIALTNKDTKKESYGIVQEFVGTGLTLEQILWERMELPTYTWLSIAEQCCEGLALFHEKGILLNDIKSNNIILDFSTFAVRIKYIDFGLATDMGGRSYRNTKSLDEFVYLAPEIRLSGAMTSIPTDIYSLGYMLDQIRTHARVEELAFITELCMDSRPEARVTASATSRLVQDTMTFLDYQDTGGYDYGHRPDCSASW